MINSFIDLHFHNIYIFLKLSLLSYNCSFRIFPNSGFVTSSFFPLR
jgi:hypothetical protein